jgi:hypothetical protein
MISEARNPSDPFFVDAPDGHCQVVLFSKFYFILNNHDSFVMLESGSVWNGTCSLISKGIIVFVVKHFAFKWNVGLWSSTWILAKITKGTRRGPIKMGTRKEKRARKA